MLNAAAFEIFEGTHHDRGWERSVRSAHDVTDDPFAPFLFQMNQADWLLALQNIEETAALQTVKDEGGGTVSEELRYAA